MPGAEKKSSSKNSSGTLWGWVASTSSTPPPPHLASPRVNLLKIQTYFSMKK